MPRRSGSALSPAVATPSTPTSPPSAFILVDRHIEKNAGSTFRELLFQNERRGLCNYWGYQLRSTPWRIFAKLMEDESNLESPDDAPLRLCIEAHSHIDYGVPWLTRMRSLVEWRKRLRGKLKVLLNVRLREPLSHYVSYYLWTVAERQYRNPTRFGTGFEQWARGVPNLQTELLLSSKAAFTASFASLGHEDLKSWQARWSTPERTQARRKLALNVLAAHDVVGTTERFAESALVLALGLNWTAYDAAPPPHAADSAPQPAETCMRRLLPSQKMWWCRAKGVDPAAERRRVHAHVCPNRTRCRELIRQIAPVDYELYDYAQRRLDELIREIGPEFKSLLAVQKRAATHGGGPRYKCAWRRMMPRLIGGPYLEANDRQALWERAPNFTTSAGACIPGPNRILRVVWGEHREGGRIANGWPAARLVPVATRHTIEKKAMGMAARHDSAKRLHASGKRVTGVLEDAPEGIWGKTSGRRHPRASNPFAVSSMIARERVARVARPGQASD